MDHVRHVPGGQVNAEGGDKCQIASNRDPRLAGKNDPSGVAETGGAEPQMAEQSRSWRAAIGEWGIMRGS